MSQHQLIKYNLGFTLIELMIGLSLAMLLTLAVANIYLQTKNTFSTQSEVNRQADEGKYALFTIQRIAYQAGYIDEANIAVYFKNMATTHGIDAKNIIKGNANSISARFYGDPLGHSISCAADSAGNSNFPQLKDSALHGYKIYLDGAQLKCGKLSAAGVVSDEQVITDNVIDFNILYGEDKADADGINIGKKDHIADAYKNTSVNWEDVYSIKVCLVTKSSKNNIAAKTTGRTYLKCDNTQAAIDANDGTNYRTFNTTVSLRNKYN
ncbi:PilW family protein [uncultured Deefgea sp.]|uniref:PilW family protein n=1 Tax=uncultured Deefgea sp. TaxID=1304914 RepID=UPI0025923C5D|nr:PilW family protein [uncultured Deefgea sp.]